MRVDHQDKILFRRLGSAKPRQGRPLEKAELTAALAQLGIEASHDEAAEVLARYDDAEAGDAVTVRALLQAGVRDSLGEGVDGRATDGQASAPPRPMS